MYSKLRQFLSEFVDELRFIQAYITKRRGCFRFLLLGECHQLLPLYTGIYHAE